MAFEICDQVFQGTIVHSTFESPLNILYDKVIGVSKTGKIVFLDDSSGLELLKRSYNFSSDDITVLEKHQFLMPGFIDTHIHAPQYPYMGTGYDMPLLDWLKTYTFPYEARYKDKEFAEKVYRDVVARTLSHGTTTASYFATIHYDATTILADITEEMGQRAYIGKVCMDRNAPDYYIESTQQSLIETEKFIKYVRNKRLVTPVITPRFVISCSNELMQKLGELSRTYMVPVQSHLSENKQEIRTVQEMYPDCAHYTDVYRKYGLLTDRSYMAHCCHVSSAEATMLAEYGTGVSHCPASNLNLRSGLADVKFLESQNVKVGLGTDVAGGHSYSMLNAIQSAITVSNVLAIKCDEYKPISHKEAFYLATLGGSKVLGLDKIVGNFEVGKEFDALVVDAASQQSSFDSYDGDNMEDVVQKFLYCGDDRNIQKVFVAGRMVAGKDKKNSNNS